MIDNAKSSTPKSPVFFGFQQEVSAFDATMIELRRQLQRQIVRERIPERNTETFNHGRSWTHRANPEIGSGQMESASAILEVRFDDVVAGTLSIIDDAVEKIAAEFQRHFSGMLYRTVSNACDQSGNVVSAQNAGSFAAGFLEAFRKIEFGVDRDGNVSLPEVHVGVDPSHLIAELERQPPEYHVEFERLKAEKIAAAMERESKRKAKFKES